MNVCISPSVAEGKIGAIASKSVAHRMLICAAFAEGETRILCEQINDDISATARCLRALGADIERRGTYFYVKPVKALNKGATLDCGESGSTMRFLVPVTCMLGADASFLMSGRLPERPLSPLREELERCGVTFSPQGSNPLVCRGQVSCSDFSISGEVSSQFISGLLFAMAISKRAGTLKIIGKLESAPYIDITADALRAFGIEIARVPDGYTIDGRGGLISPADVTVEGDWSGAAFPLSLGAIGKRPISVCGLNTRSYQGDRAILDLLRRFGAEVEVDGDTVTVIPKRLRGIEIDASQIPDLVPILATVASVAEGRTVIYNAARLRIKESDRLSAVREVLCTLGARVEETADGLIIDGVETLEGGLVSSFGDHRIAMSAAVASVRCRDKVTVKDAHAASKSYPDFWRDIKKLGICAEEV